MAGPWEKYQKPKAGPWERFQVSAPGAESSQGQQLETSFMEQLGNGLNEGVAEFAGMPVDLMTSALNLGVSGINAITGSEIDQISNPVGGSGTFKGALEGVGAITDAEPATNAQRYARSIGREAGAMVIPAGATARTAKGLLPLLGMETASAVGAGVGSQVARDIAPDSGLAEFAGGLLGGLTPVAASRAMRAAPKAPDLDDLRARQESAYGAVDQSGATVAPQASQRLRQGLLDRIDAEGVPEFLPSNVRSVAAKIEALPPNAKVTDIEDLRRLIGNDVAGSVDGQARRIGVDLKGDVDDFLSNLQPSDLSAGSQAGVLDSLSEGREMTRRIKKAEALGGDTGVVTKALRRAATSGTGGNEVNAIRQNIRTILDNPKRRRGFSKEEIAMMEQIVEGTPVTNGLRMIGRFSPTSGALPAMASGASGVTFGPLGAAPFAAGYFAKAGAEELTKRQVGLLDELVRNGAPLPPKLASEAEMMTMQALLPALAATSGD